MSDVETFPQASEMMTVTQKRRGQVLEENLLENFTQIEWMDGLRLDVRSYLQVIHSQASVERIWNMGQADL
jgi:hypothetical protein